jgi:hypothetical protein
MKKALVYGALAAGLFIILSSCSSTFKLVVDEDNPVEQNALIIVDSGAGFFILKEWNGIEIREMLYKKRWLTSNDTVRLTVPAGDTSIGFDISFTFSNQYSSTTYKMDDIELNYNFEAGKRYRITGATKSMGFFKGYELMIRLYDVTVRGTKPELLKEWTLGET